MLKFMTKASFMEAVKQRRFTIKKNTPTKFEAYYIGYDDMADTYNMRAVINPDTKDGTFQIKGHGTDKTQEVMYKIALYINENAEDKDSNPVDCVDFFNNCQRYNVI